jgi:hypothetical protein
VLLFIRTCSTTATIVCIFERVQWRWALNGTLAHAWVATVVDVTQEQRQVLDGLQQLQPHLGLYPMSILEKNSE